MEYLTDEYLFNLLLLVKNKYFIAGSLILGPVVYYGKKLTAWTPWKSDDKILEKLEEVIEE